MRAVLCIIALALLVGACTAQPDTPVSTAVSARMPTLVPTLTPMPIVETVTSAVSIPATPIVEMDTSAVPPAPAETTFPALVGSINVTSAPGIILRRAPSAAAEIVAVLPGGSVVQARRRSADHAWIEVTSAQALVGWVEAREVYALVDLALLPPLDGAVQIAAAPLLMPTRVTPGDVPAMERRLKETPILSNLTTERVRSLFAAGQGMGNQANVFTTVGDSNTTNSDFLQPIGMNADAYCTWGSYGYLRATVDYFSVPNSFTHHSGAAGKGFNTAAVLDPFWASGSCDAGESPLACEYRTVKPSAAIIMLGGIDVNDLTTVEYDANMRAIVQTSIQQGVIPVLTTFVVLPERDVYERSLEFNMSLLDIAEAEQIPLINLWAAAQTLPDEGIGPDRTHLKAQVGSFCSFDGAQQQLGGTLRNLLTLQALDELRQNVLAP